MYKKILARLIALFIVGLAAGEIMHRDYLSWHVRGRDSYLASKADYFDKHIATVQPHLVTLLVFTLILGIFVAPYEIIQRVIYKALIFSSKE